MHNHPDTKHTEVNEMEYISQKILAEHAELEESKRAAAGALWKASKSKIDDFLRKFKSKTDDAVKKADDAAKKTDDSAKPPDPWDDAAKKADDAVKSKADDAAKKADDSVKSKADDVAKKADDVKKPKKTETIPAKRGFGGNKGKRAFVGKNLKRAGLIGLGAAGVGVYNALKGDGDEGGGSGGRGSGGSGSTYSGGKVPGANISYDELRQKAAAASARGAGKDYRRDIARGIRSTSPGVFTKSDSADDPKSSRTFTRATTTPTPTTKTTTTKSTTSSTSTPSSSGKYVSPDLATLRRRAAKATMVGPSPEAQKLMSKKALAYFGKDRLAAATKAHQNIRKPMLVKEMTEQTEAYDVILEYLLDNGHADTINEANYIMLEMDSQSIQTIVEMGMPDPIDPMKHKAAQRTQKIYNKAKGGAGSEKDFLKRTGPQLPGV